jgi:hypothetical protein
LAATVETPPPPLPAGGDVTIDAGATGEAAEVEDVGGVTTTTADGVGGDEIVDGVTLEESLVSLGGGGGSSGSLSSTGNDGATGGLTGAVVDAGDGDDDADDDGGEATTGVAIGIDVDGGDVGVDAACALAGGGGTPLLFEVGEPEGVVAAIVAVGGVALAGATKINQSIEFGITKKKKGY